MGMRTVLLGATAACLTIAGAGAQSAPDTTRAAHMRAFDRADRRAMRIIEALRCAQFVSLARQGGQFGPADSLGSSGHCVTVARRTIGVFIEVDSPFVRATRFSAVDLGARSRYVAPLDTASLLAEARSEFDASGRGYKRFGDAERAFTPVTIRFDGDSIEVWLIPLSILSGNPLSAGGEVGFVYGPDGRTLARQVDAFADYRTLARVDTGVVHIASRETGVPAASEMLLANLLNRAGRTVSIDMPHLSSVLAGRGAQAAWMHIKQP